MEQLCQTTTPMLIDFPAIGTDSGVDLGTRVFVDNDLSNLDATPLHSIPVVKGDSGSVSLHELRQWLCGRIDRLPVSSADVLLVASEMATNVKRHASGRFEFAAIPSSSGLVLIAADQHQGAPPMLRSPGPDETRGRGMRIIDRLAQRWGTVAGHGGKSVWVILPWDESDRQLTENDDFRT